MLSKETALKILNSIPLRTFVLFFVCCFLMMLVADIGYTSLMAESYKSTATNLAEKIKKANPTAPEILEDIQQNNLAWYYVATADGHILKNWAAYNPQLKRPLPNVSRPVDWRDKHYWEAVAPVNDTQYVHVGFYTGPVVFSEFFHGPNAPWPFAVVFLMLSGTMVLLAIVMFFTVSQPVQNLTHILQEMLPPEKRKNDEAHDEFDFIMAPTELNTFARAFSAVKNNFATNQQSSAPSMSDDDTPISSGLAFENSDRYALGREYEELSETQNRISEVYTKEAEDEFVVRLCRELEKLRSTHQVCQRILDKLNDKFPTSIIYGAFFIADKSGHFTLEAFLGMDDRSLQNLKRIDHSGIAKETFSNGKNLILYHEAMKERGLQPLLTGTGIKTAVYLPVVHEGHKLGMIAIYFSGEGQTVSDRLRVLRTLAESTAKWLWQANLVEEEQENARTDALTGLRNKHFFTEVIPQVFNRASIDPESHPVSLVMMDGDHFAKINEVYGQVVGDQMLQELAGAIRQCVRASEGDGKSGPGDYLIRYGTDEFVIVMENTDGRRALDIAERIRWTVEQKSDWPSGLKKWTISVGVASYPADAKSANDLLAKAQGAVTYVKEEMNRNKVCAFAAVPKGYSANRQSAAIEGELGVFDGSALLQSLATAGKTGMLTVTSPDGKELWMVFESGKPVQAGLGKFYGAAAIVEFVTVVSDGAFNFRDLNASTTITKLPKRDDAYNVTRGLERCLMDGALAQDNYNAAKVIIPSTEVILRPVHAMEFSVRWDALAQLPEPPTKDELNVMSDMVQRADGKTTLTTIFKAMDNVQTAVLWRSAAMLIQHGLVQTKPAVAV